MADGKGSFYQIIDLGRDLSLDVVIGAVASGYMASRLAGVTMPLVWWIALPLAVWVMYTADHLMDAQKLGERSITRRHRLHFRYFRIIAAIWLIGAGLGGTWLFWWSPMALRLLALAIGGLALIHLGLVWLAGMRGTPWPLKEWMVGLIYTLGVWGGPWVLTDTQIKPLFYLAALQFFALAMINLLLFARYEMSVDVRQGQSSFVHLVGVGFTNQLILFLGLMLLALGAWGAWHYEDNATFLFVQLIYLAMLVCLGSIAFLPKLFEQKERYRWLGDLVFWLPALISISG